MSEPQKLSERLREADRLGACMPSFTEMAVEVDALEAEVKTLNLKNQILEEVIKLNNEAWASATSFKVKKAESRIAEAEKLPEAIARVLNIRFGIGSWENIEFDCSAFDACDSINAVGDIATILRTSWPEKSLRGVGGDEK